MELDESLVGENDDSANKDIDAINKDRKCGVGPCKPSCMMRCANMILFTFFYGIMSLFYGLGLTYLMGMLTTIEKSLKISSKASGFITSVNDIGFLVTTIFVSYFASRAHKPLIIGISAALIGIGNIITALPYFIFGQLTPTFDSAVTSNLTNLTVNTDICSIDNSSYKSVTELCAAEKAEKGSMTRLGPIIVIMVGQLIIGLAASPVWSLGMSYIDDNVKKHFAPLYLGVLFSLRTVSPLLGFVSSGFLIRVYINFNPPSYLKMTDREWVGCWWLGFLVIGILLLLSSVPIGMFPKVMPIKKENRKKKIGKLEKLLKEKAKNSPLAMIEDEGEFKLDIKGFPKAIKRLFTNWIYVFQVLTSMTRMFYITGFMIFLPKYIEKVFYKTPDRASFIIGVMGATPLSIGTLLSGIMVSRLKLDNLGNARALFITNMFAALIFPLFFVLQCPQLPIAGVEYGAGQIPNNLTQPCNMDCYCPTNDFDPVCGSDGMTYYTPCHAGCRSPEIDRTYYNCSCISGGNGTATSGLCRDKTCQNMIPFSIALFAMNFVSILGMMCGIMLVFRSVSTHDKPLAIGILTAVASLMAIPAPIVFGAIIDGSCHTKHACSSSVCLFYNNIELRYRYILFGLGLKVADVILLGIQWIIMKIVYNRKKKAENSDLADDNNIKNSEDKL